MKSRIFWILAVVLLLVVVLALPFALRFTGWGWHAGMMGWRGLPREHFGYFSPFGFWGMGFAMLLPAAFLVLLVLGGVALVNSLTRPALPPSQPVMPAGKACPSCGKPVQMDWAHCPHCGTTLS